MTAKASIKSQLMMQVMYDAQAKRQKIGKRVVAKDVLFRDFGAWRPATPYAPKQAKQKYKSPQAHKTKKQAKLALKHFEVL